MLIAVSFPTSVLVILTIVALLDSLIVDVKEMADGNGVLEDIDMRSESVSMKLAWPTAPCDPSKLRTRYT